MDPTFRKIALIAATLGLLLSLFLALRPDDEDDNGAAPATTSAASVPTTTSGSTTVTETEPPPPPPSRKPAVVRIRLTVVDGQPVGGLRRAKVKQGRRVVIVTRADVSDHIHLHGYDLMADVAPGSPARIEFRATIPGRFEIELEDRGVQIADLSVTP